ncbi:MAG: hypothetical protein WCB22_32850 [Pseudolabrys sp.]
MWGEISFGDGSVEQLARVANYGVSCGLTRRTADGAPVALPFPENITRKVNQYRGFIGYRHPHFLKARFILDGTGRVEWIHRPQVDTEGFVILYRAEAVPHEYLLPDTRDGPLTLCFPYVLTRERVRPSWGDFFPPAPGADGRDRQRGETPS